VWYTVCLIPSIRVCSVLQWATNIIVVWQLPVQQDMLAASHAIQH
jgi:hypothetical protein